MREVCIETGPLEASTNPKIRDYILSTYCEYYLDNEKENCFILIDEEKDKAVGYVLCCSDIKRFRKGAKKYFSSPGDVGLMNALECRGEVFAHELFGKNYPAHLHINISENYRNGGCGSKLISTLLSHLEKEGVKGICLICGYGNKEAIRFYKRNGFVPGLNIFFQGLLMKRKIG